jgi:predicted aldo/keto reductase-like oxidoreductase
MKRRSFVKLGAAGSLALQFPHIFGAYTSEKLGDIPKRVLGKTGEKVTVLGFGGIALRNNGQDFANELIALAYDRGISYYDIAPSYGDSQELMGPALKPYRNKTFLACKTQARDRQGSLEELHQSLEHLKTDHVDLYQFHALSKMEQVDQIFGPDGAMETFQKARQDGKIRFIGFSAHNEAVALKAMDMFDFDSILYPINCVCWYNGDFGPRVVETARKKNMGIMAIKAIAKTRLAGDEKSYPNLWYHPYEEDELIEKSLQFTLSKDITGTVHAGDSIFMKKTLQVIEGSKEFTAPDKKDIMAMIKDIKPIFNHPET